MKYALLTFNGKFNYNLGDELQLIVTDQLMTQAQIPASNRIQIPYNELSNWIPADKTPVYLPINFPFLKGVKGIDCLFSDYIHPIFIGFTWLCDYLSSSEIAYLRRFEPIGCRDEYTYHTMQKYGIHSWLNGCATLTYDASKPSCSGTSTFFVDVPEAALSKIPAEITSHAKYLSQVISKDSYGDRDALSIAKERYAYYRENAGLVVTSRLHCAVPCLAMGIPVIMIVNNVSFRMSWLEKLLPIYTVDEIDSIDWSYPVRDCGQIIQLVRQNAVNVLHSPYIWFSEMQEITAFYENRTRKPYFVEGYTNTLSYIDEQFSADPHAKYAFWGLTLLTNMLQRYIESHYPQAHLVKVYDKTTTGYFQQIPLQPISDQENLSDIHLIVTASAANKEASLYVQRNALHKFFFCYTDII